MIINKTVNPLSLRWKKERLDLEPGILTPLEKRQKAAFDEAFAQSDFFKALEDTGAVERSSAKTAPEQPLEKLTAPQSPAELFHDAEKNGRKARVRKFEKDGLVAV